MKRFISEFIGTFFLTFIVLLSVTGSFESIATPLLAALTLGLCVYTLGHFSGTHVNPAVTLGLLSINKIHIKDAVIYIVAQVLGAFVALMIVISVFNKTVMVPGEINLVTFMGEIFGAAIFTFGIAACVLGRVKEEATGIVVGLSLLLGIMVAVSIGSNGILNPAIAFALGSVNLYYVLGPVIGSVLGFNLYNVLNKLD